MSTVPPPNLSLLPNQFYWDTSTLPGRIWVGVPTTEDPTGRKMVLDTSVIGAGFPEAPINGTTFGRKDGGWNAVLPLTGGTLSGGLTIASVAAPTLTITAPSLGAGPLIALNNVASPNLPGGSVRASRNGSIRWDTQLASGDAESTGNAGSYFQIIPYSDAGASLGVMFRLTRLGNGFLDVNSFAFGQPPRNSLFISPGATATAPVVLTQSGTGGLVLPTLKGGATISNNAAVPVLGPSIGYALQLIGADAAVSLLDLDAYGAAPTLMGRRANGTALAPTGVLANDFLLAILGRGHNASAFGTGTRAQIAFAAAANWGATDQSTYMTFSTTAVGTVTPLVERMRITDAGAVWINGNTAAITTITPGTYFHIQGADNTVARALIDGVGTAAVPTITGRRAMGTGAVRTPLAVDEVMLALHGRGFGATAFSTIPRVGIEMRAAENWSDASQGTYLAFLTGTTGTNGAMAEAMRIAADRTVLIGKTTSLGLVNLEVAGGAIIDQITATTTTAPLIVTDKAVTAFPVPSAGTLLQLVGTGAAGPRIELNAFAGNVSIIGRVAGGTPTAPTPVTVGQVIALIGGQGWNGSIYGATAQIQFNAAENFTPTAYGGYIAFAVVGVGTNARREVVRITDAGALQFAVTGPSISVGAGAPASTQPNGSIYLRNDGGTGTRFYVSQGGGVWAPVPGV